MKHTVRGWRIYRGYTKGKMTELMGVSEPTYSSWEQDPGKMRLSKIVEFAKICEVDLEDIIFFEDNPKLNFDSKEAK